MAQHRNRSPLMTTSLLICIFSMMAPLSTSAQNDIRSMGVHIVSGNWKPARHADRTFSVLQNYQKILRKYDFYYQLVLHPNYKLTFSNCGQSPRKRDFFNRFVGISRSSFLAITATVRHKGQRGITGASGAEGNGCFFDQALSNLTPLIRYSGRNDEDFDFKFKIVRTTNVQANFVSRVKELFTAMNAAFSFTDLTGARVTAYNTAATQLQTAFNDASKVTNTNSSNLAMHVTGIKTSRYAISMPEIISPDAGYFAFYVQLKGSHYLTSDSAPTPGDILTNNYLGTKTCFPKPGSKLVDCAPAAKTFREYLGEKIKDLPVRFFDLRSSLRSKVADTWL
jgi:hypothetical protein